MAKPKIAIIGPGVVGQAIGRLLREKRFPVAAVAGRSSEGTRAAIEFIGAGKAARSVAVAAKAGDIVFLTTPDRMIRPVCEEIAAAKGFKRGATVFHCSGAHGAEVLEAARGQKARVAALHPCQTFATRESALKRMKGTHFSFEGDDEAAPVAELIAGALGGKVVRIKAQNRAMYHAALCALSNYVVAIADLGVNMMQVSGMTREEAAEAAKPLLKGTLDNIAEAGLPAALTGPISRGDVETVERHIAALNMLPRDIRRLYCELGLYTMRVAQRKGTLKPPEALSLARVLRQT